MHVLVDGYNVMYSLPVGEEWPGAALKDRRADFLRRLKAYVGERAHRVTVVFDGGKGGSEEGGADHAGAIRILFSPKGVEADDVLRDMVEREPRASDVLLVSSDKSVAGFASSLGASTARADELAGKLRPLEAGTRRSGAGAGGRSRRRENLRLW